MVGCNQSTSSQFKVTESKPENIVNLFLNSFKSGDYEHSFRYVDTEDNSYKDLKKLIDQNITMKFNTKVDKNNKLTKSVLESITKNYIFEEPLVLSNDGNIATVEVKITSIDFGETVGSAFNDMMYYVDSKEKENKSIDTKESLEIFNNSLIKNFSSENPKMFTRTVTLNLKKDENDIFKIIPDENLLNTFIGNYNGLSKYFSE